MKTRLLEIEELKKYRDYVWTEIDIGCSDTCVFEISNENEILFVKVGKSGMLSKEHSNLKKLINYLNVPKVVFYYNQDVEILITTKMAGKMSCDDEFIDFFPDKTISILCEAIKEIQSIKIDTKLRHDFQTFYIDEEIEKIKERLDRGELINLPDKKVFDGFKNINEVVSYLENNKPEGDFCLSHGDVSMPNVFIQGNNLSGFIDVGNAGIRQKWYDITDAYISIRRNFESQAACDEFLKKLGIQDMQPIEYYEMLIYLS
ncbi:MAG: phosphotransferase [Clostridia bacterium]|nr:phosphotransferase [Clostridia bacterium]